MYTWGEVGEEAVGCPQAAVGSEEHDQEGGPATSTTTPRLEGGREIRREGGG